MTAGVEKARKEQRQFRTLTDDLKELDGKIAAAKRLLDNFKFDQEEAKRLTKLLGDLNATKAALQPEVTALQAHHKRLGEHISQLDALIKPKQEQLADITGMTTAAQELRATLTEEIRQLKLDKNDLISSKKTGLKDSLGTINRDKDAANDTLKTINKAIATAQKKANSLADKVKQHDEVVEFTVHAQDTLDALMQSIKQRTADAKKAEKTLADLDGEIAAKRTAFDAECKKKTVALNIREKDLEQREGDLNRVAEWNKKKAGLLRQAKGELEEIHGRPLRHIIIPPDEE